MMSIADKLATVKAALIEVSTDCYHYFRPASVSAPYIVWAEDGEAESSYSDNHKQEQQLTGTVDYFTLTEFDSVVDDIQTALDEIDSLGWTLDAVLWEEETNLIHYSWSWRY